MNETLQKINELLKTLNNTFEISADVFQEDNENIANGLKIDSLKNNGSEFIKELFDTFGTIVTSVSNEHELVYSKDRGIVIAKKVVTVNYVIEE